MIWVGANDGMMHAFDARTGVEVYAFIPFNLLAKLKALPDGHAIGSPDYFVDSSAETGRCADRHSRRQLRGLGGDVLADVSLLRPRSRRHVLSGTRRDA